MVKIVHILSLGPALVALWSLPVSADSAPEKASVAVRDDAEPPALPNEFVLPTTTAAQATEPESWIQVGDHYLVHNVSKPTLAVFLPAPETANGTAVVIAPGGGFMMLSMSSEGWDVARWLASKGIAAFVLKYRLTPTPRSAAAMQATMASRLGGKDLFGSQWFNDGTQMAVEDASAAMRLVRANSAKWNVDPNKVGFLGFSAGAFTTLGLVNRADDTTMPDFVAPIYGSLQTPDRPLPAKLPPMWTSIAADDPILGQTDFGLLNAWRATGATVEFHLYDKGGHGYGFAGTPGTTTVNWPNEFLAWLESRGLYAPRAARQTDKR